MTFECIAVMLLPGELFMYILMLFSMEGSSTALTAHHGVNG